MLAREEGTSCADDTSCVGSDILSWWTTLCVVTLYVGDVLCGESMELLSRTGHVAL